MRVSVLLIKTDTTLCLIEKDDSHWLDILKESICEYLKERYIAERDSVLLFCDAVKTFKELQVLVNTFINPIYPFSWIIAPSILPDLHDMFLLVDETIPEIIESLAPLEPVPYVPSKENLHKLMELEAQKRLLELEETQRLKELQIEIEKSRLLDELAKLNANLITEHVSDNATPE